MKLVRLFSLTAAVIVAAALVGHAQGQQQAEHGAPPSAPSRPAPLTDEDRAQAEQRLNDAWGKLPFWEKSKLMRMHRALREMSPEERHFIQDRIERFINMPPEEREKIRQNYKRWQEMTPEERQQARERFQERRRDFIERWKRDHPGEEPPPFPFHKHPPAATTNDNREPPPQPPPPQTP